MSKITITESRLKQIIKEEITSLLIEKVNDVKNNIYVDAPSYKKPLKNSFTVFLAGTIDADKGSVDWQHKICDKIEKMQDNKTPITVYNPRREDWTDNGSSEVKKQIRWEHNHMDDADLIIMNILEDSKSPISLMEIGMYAASGKLEVFCKPGFYRYDNVQMVCKKYNVPLHNTNDIDEIIKVIYKKSGNGKYYVNEDYVFHYSHGKEHDMRPYGSDNKFAMIGRDTGHFGSGTYFSTYMFDKDNAELSKYKSERLNDPQFIKIDNNVYRVDIDLYKNLYRVNSKKEGAVLYTTLKNVNNLYNIVSEGSYDCQKQYQIIRNNCQHLGLKCPSYKQMLQMALNHSNNNDDIRSFSTVFMEYNGYNGVNVSGIYGLDNTLHGSVIYDLSKVGGDIQQVNKKDINDFNITADNNMYNSIAYDMFSDDDENIKALSGKGGKWETKLNNMELTQAKRLLKNYTFSGNIIDDYYLSELNKELRDWYMLFLYKHMGRIDITSFIKSNSAIKVIAEDKLWYWLNYKTYDFSLLLTLISKYRNELDYNLSEKEEKEKTKQYCTFLLSKINRELTSKEQSKIEKIMK